MAIAVGSFVRWAITSDRPPPADINTNSAMAVTAISATDVRGAMLTCARQGKYVGIYPQSIMVEVRAP